MQDLAQDSQKGLRRECKAGLCPQGGASMLLSAKEETTDSRLKPWDVTYQAENLLLVSSEKVLRKWGPGGPLVAPVT